MSEPVPPRPVGVDLTRLAEAHYRVTNERGGAVEMYAGEQGSDLFTPVELLLAAVAGCAATGVDSLTVRRSEPSRFEVRIDADRVRDETGNRLDDILVAIDVEFPPGDAGDRARARLDGAIEATHERLCTVSRTIELGTPVAMVRAEPRE